jgi:hypothetical protein
VECSVEADREAMTAEITWLHAVVDVPSGRLVAAADFWSAALDWPAGTPWPGHPGLRSFEPPDGDAYVHLQEIGGPGRVHLDLESVAPDATVSRATDAGAVLVAEHAEWRTLRSPGGLPFCVVAATERGLPSPRAWPDGHRSRMVQVCIDSPAPQHETEAEFWHAVLGERWVPSPAPEFAAKWHNDAGSPLQLLFQRLDEVEGPVRAHLDHGTDDLAAEVRRLCALGAEDIGPGRAWHVLRDPAGLLCCVTENSPELDARRRLD